MKKYQLLGSASGIMQSIAAGASGRRRGTGPRQSSPYTPPSFELCQPLGKGERGGVIGIAAEITPPPDNDASSTGFGVNGRGNDEGAVKLALLMVDKIDKPRNSFINFGEDGEADLTGLGLGSQSRVVFRSGMTFSQMTSYVWEAYTALEEREPGLWSLWQQRGVPIIPSALLTPGLAFQLELSSGLIVPDASTPYEDVIAFKDRHRDELIALRHHLEEFAIKLSKEGDPRAVNLERERFDVSLSEYLKKARQSNIKRAVASLTTELDWAAAVRSAVSGGGGGGLLATAQGLSLTHTAAAIGGGVLASLSIKSVAGIKDGPSPFRYIARIEKEYGG